MARNRLVGPPEGNLGSVGVRASAVAGPPPASLGFGAAAAWQAFRVANELRRLREQRRESRADLAGRLGLHWRTIENIERGWTWPDFVSLVAFTRGFGLDVFAGLEGTSQPVHGRGTYERDLVAAGQVGEVVVSVTFRLQRHVRANEWRRPAVWLTEEEASELLQHAGPQAAVGYPDGQHPTLLWQGAGDVSLEGAVAAATGVLREVFEDVAVLRVTAEMEHGPPTGPWRH